MAALKINKNSLNEKAKSLNKKSIPKIEFDSVSINEVISIKLSDLRENKDNPRKEYDSESIEALANSIKKSGLIQPLVVRRSGREAVILAGHRRFRALQLLKKETAECIVREGNYSDPKEPMRLALIENLQREGLNAYEIAEGINELSKMGEKVNDIEKVTGYKRTSIFDYKKVFKLVSDGIITKEELIKKGIKTIKDMKSPTVGLSKKKNKSSLKNQKKFTIKVNDFLKKKDVEKAIEKTEKVLLDLKKQLKEIG